MWAVCLLLPWNASSNGNNIYLSCLVWHTPVVLKRSSFFLMLEGPVRGPSACVEVLMWGQLAAAHEGHGTLGGLLRLMLHAVIRSLPNGLSLIADYYAHDGN